MHSYISNIYIYIAVTTNLAYASAVQGKRQGGKDKDKINALRGLLLMPADLPPGDLRAGTVFQFGKTRLTYLIIHYSAVIQAMTHVTIH